MKYIPLTRKIDGESFDAQALLISSVNDLPEHVVDRSGCVITLAGQKVAVTQSRETVLRMLEAT